jgi:RHS repeat-associated protein
VNNIRLPGQYYDSETGLHYNYHRYYDPRTGRYLTPDPIGPMGGINLFEYSQNNPLCLVDPFGLMDIGEAYGYIEGALKPYLVAGGLVVTGAATSVAGGALAITGYGSIPATGPAGLLVGTTGVLVAGAGVAQFVLGLDVYSDEIRYRLGLPIWFDVIRGFELLPQAQISMNEKEGSCE